MSIVKGILTSHEFPFGVSSEEGKGSMFWFEIKSTKSVKNANASVETKTEQKRKKQ